MSSAFPHDDPEYVTRRASSFGAEAAAYADHRPGYPSESVRWALDDAPGPRVLDLAAGTGKLTEELLPLTTDLVAVEPDPEMLAELRRRLPGVRALQGSAESIPLPDGSVDAILVGQAMHWFDQEYCLPELARVLSPGGTLTGLWNLDDDRVPWLRTLKDMTGNTASYLNNRPVPLLTDPRYFTPPTRAEFPNPQPRDIDSMLATIQTHSQVLVLPPAERAALLEKARAYLAFTPETAAGPFLRPMITVALHTTKRRGGRRPRPRPQPFSD